MVKVTKMQVSDAISWLYSYTKYGSKLGLERITVLLERLGNPHHHLPVIHVTGTNGKGSVCRFLGSILTHAGYKTGVYLSPHLENFSERIVIDGNLISNDDLVGIIQQIQPIVSDLEGQEKTPTFFEIVTAIAFQYFAEQQVDYAVIEVGLGGRFDATNVVHPLVSVITDISLEHTEYLGKSITSVAFEKAGIIKPGAPVVTAAKNEAFLIIEAIAKEHQISVVKISPDIWKRVRHSLDTQGFLIKGALKEYDIQTSLLGEYQGENIAVAVHTIEQLQMLGIYITDKNVIAGIQETENPGRMEVLTKEPLVVLDGAHNPAGMNMLRASLKNDFQYDRLVMVVGILRDKNIDEMLKAVVPIVDELIVTKSENPRACEPEIIVDKAKKQGFAGLIREYDTVIDAVQYAVESVKIGEMVCITGSLFTVGEARSYLIYEMKKAHYTIKK
jgi:dihydrofolate synthase/folylpolyglutamate synthase